MVISSSDVLADITAITISVAKAFFASISGASSCASNSKPKEIFAYLVPPSLIRLITRLSIANTGPIVRSSPCDFFFAGFSAP